VCALCICLLSKRCLEGLRSFSSIQSKKLDTHQICIRDVNFKIITFHTIIFLGFEAWMFMLFCLNGLHCWYFLFGYILCVQWVHLMHFITNSRWMDIWGL
jgi:hypothetical protein